MRLWATARNGSEREALLEEARASGDLTASAARLGITRRHLSRLLNGDAANEGFVTMSLEIPRELLEWLEIEALREKHRTGAPHASKGVVVGRLIRQAMAEKGPGS